MAAKLFQGGDLAPVALILAAAAATVVGRVALKGAALRAETMVSPAFALAAAMSLLATACWLAALRGPAPLAALAVVYGMGTMLALMAADAVVFGARLDLRSALGVACALLSVALVSGR